MFRFIRIPFQFKVYLLFLAFFLLLLQLVTSHIRSIVTDQLIKNESARFEDLRTLVHNLITNSTKSLRNEAMLLAGQAEVRETLDLVNQGEMRQSFLRQYYPSTHPHNFLIFTDHQGQVVDGFITLKIQDGEIWIEESNELQEIIGTIPSDIIESNKPGESFVTVKYENQFQLFAISTVPAYSLGLNPQTIGTITLGFAVDSDLAMNLQKNSPIEIGFVVGGTPISSSLPGLKNNTFRRIWYASIEKERSSLLIEPEIISVDQALYMAYASYLQQHVNQEKVAYVLFTSLDNTMGIIRYLDQSVNWVNVIIFSGMLIIGYVLARRVTAPVRRLSETVQMISEGNYEVNSSVRSGDELETLGDAVQHLAEKLQLREKEAKKYVKQIEEWNRELESKVSERTKELEEKNMTLKATSKELENAYNQIDEELQVVGILQKKLLPDANLNIDGIKMKSYYTPNGRAGGDYYDYYQTGNDCIYCLIADVAGHGTPAAFIMGITRTITHSLMARRLSPQQILHRLSTQLFDTTRRGEFVTMFLARIDLKTNNMTYSIAGHPPPLFFEKKTGIIHELKVDKGLPLGIIDTSEYEEIVVPFDPGDRLLLFTDGIVECFNPVREAYGELRLQQQLNSNINKPANEFLTEIIHDLSNFVQHPLDVEPLEDDVTLVCIDFTARTEPVLHTK